MKYTKAVSATLAGALAVGMVPAMAFAAEGDQELELMATTNEAIAAGSMVLKTGQTAGMSFTAGTDDNYLCPVSVMPDGVGTTAVAVTEVNIYKITTATAADYLDTTDSYKLNGELIPYSANAKYTVNQTTGEWTKVSNSGSLDVDSLLVGNYAIGVKAGSDVVVAKAETFSVTATQIAGLSIYEANGAGALDPMTDTEFVYSGADFTFGDSKGNIAFKLNGVAVDENLFDVKVFDANNSLVTGKMYAGTYSVYIVGKSTGKYAGQYTTLPLTVKPFDLSTALISVADQDDAEDVDTLAEIQGKLSATGLPAGLNLKVTKVDPAVISNGTYTATVAADIPATDQNYSSLVASVINTKAVKFNVVGALNYPVTAVYDDNNSTTDYAFGASAATLPTINYSENDKAFDPALIKVSLADNPLTTTANDKMDLVLGTHYTLSYIKTDGAAPVAVDAAALANAGTYTVQAKLIPSAFNYAIAGDSALLNVTVTGGDVASAGMAVAYKNVAQYAANAGADIDVAGGDYNGTDALANLDIVLKAGTKTLAEGADYTLEITKTHEGTVALATPVKVTEAKDAGVYEIVAKSTSYNVTGCSKVVLTVSPANAATVKVAGEFEQENNGNMFPAVFYTGSDIALDIEYLADAKTSAAADDVYADLPASSYKMSIEEYYELDSLDRLATPTSVKAPGWYKIKIEDVSSKDNYAVTRNENLWVAVSDKPVFADVPLGQWYSEVVYQAASLDYVNGIQGTNTFRPNKDITRAELVAILFNMAGGQADPAWSNIEYTSFADVPTTHWGAKAIAWAKDAGVANGRGDGTNFDPEATVTREEAAAFFANYAAAFGEYEAAGADAYAGYAAADVAGVSAWAKGVVAWALENDVIGNGGVINAKGNVTRAQAAAMAVNYQPEGIKAGSKF